jgi:hypothetical protein
LIALDLLGRIEPFQGVAATRPKTKIFLFLSRPSSSALAGPPFGEGWQATTGSNFPKGKSKKELNWSCPHRECLRRLPHCVFFATI